MIYKYAQEIAESTAKTINHHIIITDRYGIIIGASDPSRGVGTLHEASLRVLKSKEWKASDEENSRKFRNTIAGITYPVIFEKNILGTVGIAGNPEEVIPLGRLVGNHIEIILREKQLLESSLNQESVIQRLVTDCIHFHPDKNDIDLFVSRANSLGYNLKLPQIPVLIELENKEQITSHQNDNTQKMGKKNSSPYADLLLFQALRDIRSIFDPQNNLSSIIGPNKCIVLYQVQDPLKDITMIKQELYEKSETLFSKLTENNFSSLIGIGTLTLNLEELPLSYSKASGALSIGKIKNKAIPVYDIANYQIEELMLSTDKALGEEFIGKYLKSLKEQPNWEEIKDTLMEWVKSDCNMSKVSEALHIHRNTLDYRINKIRQISGFDPRSTITASCLFFAILMDMLFNISINNNLEDSI